MSGIIVESSKNVTLVGGGAVSRTDLETVRAQAPVLVAADGGARHAIAIGVTPDAVIGDLDSLSEEMRADIPPDRLHRISEQDSTDFEKCLSRISAPLTIGLGFMGPRTDHQLAAFHGLVRCAHQPCLLVGETQVAFLCPPKIDMTLTRGSLLSVFPLTTIAARSTGLVWPLDGLELAPDRQIGTSNRVSHEQVMLSSDRPGLLVILPGQEWEAAQNALLNARARWPVHAR